MEPVWGGFDRVFWLGTGMGHGGPLTGSQLSYFRPPGRVESKGCNHDRGVVWPNVELQSHGLGETLG